MDARIVDVRSLGASRLGAIGLGAQILDERVTRDARSDADGVVQSLAAGGDHFSSIVMPAMATDMMRTLQLPAIAAIGVSLHGQTLVAATHTPARGRRLTFRDSHGTKSSTGSGDGACFGDERSPGQVTIARTSGAL